MLKVSSPSQMKGKTMKCIDLQKRYGDRYRIARDPSAGSRNRDAWLWTIPCKHGEIYPYGGEHLAAMVTATRVANQMRRWSELEVIQDADDAVAFRFNVEHFEKVADRLGARIRRQYSPEALERMRTRAENARNLAGKPNRERVQEPRSEGSNSLVGFQSPTGKTEDS